jgi:DNA repair exonuclease SbcCD ATPase subunit
MIPLKLILRGFLTYRYEATLDFENMRTVVIVGDNGHGKSALFDAITYALFGQHRGGKTRALVNQESRRLRPASRARLWRRAAGRPQITEHAWTRTPPSV